MEDRMASSLMVWTGLMVFVPAESGGGTLGSSVSRFDLLLPFVTILRLGENRFQLS